MDEAFILWINGRLTGLSEGWTRPEAYDEKRDAIYQKLRTASEVYREYLRDRQTLDHWNRSLTPLGKLSHKEAVQQISELSKKSSP